MGQRNLEQVEIKNRGLIEVEGMQFHDIEGGFGKRKKSMLVKEIAEIHDMKLKVVNQNINRNKKRFTEGIDIIDLKGTEFEVTLSDHEIYSQNALNRSTNIYLLSERGYSKLLKILEDDFAWEQYEKLVDGYFNMRENIKQDKKMSSSEILELQLKIFKEQDEKIDKVSNKVIDLEENLPLFNVDCHELQGLVKTKGKQVLGGYKSNAYNDRSIRAKVYFDIQAQIKREFGVNTYKSIRRKDLHTAKRLVENYILPTHLVIGINALNNGQVGGNVING